MVNLKNEIITKFSFAGKMYLILLSLLLLFIAVPVLYGATFNVNTFGDSHAADPASATGLDANGKISLRSAIETADSAGGANTIILPEGTYTLTLGGIKFGNKAQNLTITGSGDSANTIIFNELR